VSEQCAGFSRYPRIKAANENEWLTRQDWTETVRVRGRIYQHHGCSADRQKSRQSAFVIFNL